MEQGPSIWLILIWLLFMAVAIGGWVRLKSWRSGMDAQLAGAPPAIPDGAAATLTLLRKHRFIGMRIVYYISLDGQAIARLANARFVTVTVPAGEHVLTLSDGGDAVIAPMTVTLLAGEEVFVDCSTSGLATGVTLKTVDPTEARREMAALKLAV